MQENNEGVRSRIHLIQCLGKLGYYRTYESNYIAEFVNVLTYC